MKSCRFMCEDPCTELRFSVICSERWFYRSVGRHQAFEFFKPVLDDDRLGRAGAFITRVTGLDHQESLAVPSHIVAATRSHKVVALEQNPGSSWREARIRLNRTAIRAAPLR